MSTATKVFSFCPDCSPVNGKEVTECSSDFHYCAGGHFFRPNSRSGKIIKLQVELKETLHSTNAAQSQNGGNYTYHTYTVTSGGEEPVEEVVPELRGQSCPVSLGAPTPTPEEQARVTAAVESIWKTMEENAAGLDKQSRRVNNFLLT